MISRYDLIFNFVCCKFSLNQSKGMKFKFMVWVTDVTKTAKMFQKGDANDTLYQKRSILSKKIAKKSIKRNCVLC